MYPGPLLKHQRWDLVTSEQQQRVSKARKEQWDGAALFHRARLPPHVPLHISAAAYSFTACMWLHTKLCFMTPCGFFCGSLQYLLDNLEL